MKRTILIFIFMAAAAISAAAQPRAERERISKDEYQKAIDSAYKNAESVSERSTSVSKDYSENVLIKTETEVSECLPGGRYKNVTVTEEEGRVTEREEWVRVGEKYYHRINNGKWKKPPMEVFTMIERPPGEKIPVVKDEYFRSPSEKEGQPDVYIWEQITTTDGVRDMTVHKYSILGGMITAFEYTKWEKTPENITSTQIRKFEHGVTGIKITLPVIQRRKK